MVINKMKIKYYAVIFMIILFTGLITGCSSNAEDNQTKTICLDSESCDLESGNLIKKIIIDKLEIYHFHATKQCISCITLGDYAEETVNTYFKDELESGIIVFDHINADLPENKELITKYKPIGSSLFLGIYDGDSFNAEEDINIWYKLKDKQGYMDYLKDEIEQKLAGN